jgi:asparagine synthase (glutamine-hydrolysing)
MCGIVGAFTFGNGEFRISESYIESMRDAMSHRGPDGAGAYISPDRRVGLGHRRLSIIDLSASANQPMSNEDDSLWVVFNGEIYNHAEIRSELEALGGHRWKTDHSDSEVILHAFEQWGIDCVHRFRGMFAFALWDDKQKELWLVRDRIGVKPLAYSIHHGRITFASEIKALLRDPQQKREINEEAFYHYLTFLTTSAPQTLFKGIEKLRPGTWLRIKGNGEIKEQRYWDVWDHTQPMAGVSENEVCEQLIAELRTSVKLRKISDVPVGVFLSGGIDSSTNTALFSEGDNQRVKTFAIGYDADYGSYKNELHYARKMAELANAEHHERILKQDDLLDFLPRMIQLQDEPIGDPVCVPLYYVSKLARENGVIVCQVGEGSDELFCGYPRWKTMLQLQGCFDLPIPQGMKNLGVMGLQRLGGHPEKLEELRRRDALGLPLFWGGSEVFTEAEKMRLLSPRMQQQFASLTSWEALRDIRERFEQNAWDKSPLNWMTYLDLNFRLPELLLMRVDKMSMGVSLEGRVPFLDHKFVELAMSIPWQMKIKGGNPKHILKKAVRGIIPDELIDRKKQGFGVPIQEWFDRELGAFARQEIDQFTAQTDLLNPDEVRKHLSAANGSGFFKTWILLNVVLWWKEYIAQTSSTMLQSTPAYVPAS